MRIAIESPAQPDVIALIDALDAYQVPLYPIESHHGIDIDALSAPNVLFAVARDDNGDAIGCCAIVIEPEYGEIKRMYTQPQARGKGVARALVTLLETEARAQGCTCFMLETGYLQPEAIAFYESMGYRTRPPFGSYQEDPNSIFMSKR